MIKRALMVIVAGVAIYLLVPRLGGLSRDAAALRHANVWLALLGIAAEVASIAAYVTLYRSLLRAEHAEVPWLAAGRGVMSAFLISHVLPGGSAAGTVVNSCCALTNRVGISRPSITMRTAGVNLSPVNCKLKSAGVRAYTLEGETPDATSGGVGVGDGVGMMTSFGVGDGAS